MNPENRYDFQQPFCGKQYRISPGGQYLTTRAAYKRYEDERVDVPRDTLAELRTIRPGKTWLDMMIPVMYMPHLAIEFIVPLNCLNPPIPLDPIWLRWREEELSKNRDIDIDSVN